MKKCGGCGGGPPTRDIGPAVGLSKLSHGLTGVTKAVFGVGQVPDNVRIERRETCGQCDRATKRPLTTLTKCRECGCYLAAKTKLAAEACPLGKWSTWRVPDGPR